MSAIILPDKLRTQPQRLARIDSSGLGKGVQFLFNPAMGARDIVTGRAWSKVNSPVIAAGRHGFEMQVAGSYYDYSGYPEITGSRGTFFAWLPVVGAPSSFGGIYFSSSSPIVFAHQITNGNLPILSTSLNGNVSVSPWFNTTGRALVASTDGTTSGTRLFIDGIDTNQTFTGSAANFGTGNKSLRLGGYAGGGSWDANCSILIAGYTTQLWGNNEAKAFYEDPWQIFQPQERRLWPTSAPAGSNGTVTYTNINDVCSAIAAADSSGFNPSWARNSNSVIGMS